ncbi:PorP/SprF family type IX secretion system membrane protein [Chryseobacterium sp. G0201]|uniref:PorP/SprF family type IX secretion system membrane protein n=1 Tax=Chryseobacterium sp. G0201 TaxID=2487065 RepID=UPI001E30768F|nr:PorP/SprF family type IX secretion system membrane protein [Chryseobacterium sp. G0201]
MKTTKYMIIAAGIFLVTKTYAQLNPMGSSYYQNQYLANPAMAGITKGWQMAGSYKAQWTAIEGAPSMQSFSVAYGTLNNKIGLGLNFYTERAGVIGRNTARVTYAYHLPLNNENNFIDFGITAGITSEWIDYQEVVAQGDDQSISNFNNRPLYIDGDFGFSYRNEKLTLQGSLSNLKRLLDRDFKRNVADRSLYMGAVSYKFMFAGNPINSIVPKVMYRGVENFRNMIDLGTQIECYQEKFMINAIYHSTGSCTIGLGTQYNNQLRILCFYTTGTIDLQKYSNGEFEIAFHYSFK